MLRQPTLFDSTDATSSEELADGNTLCVSPDGQMDCQSGREAAHVSRSALPGSVVASPTSGICGQRCSGSSASASLQSALASRLQALMGCDGSMEYSLTWKERVTPAGRLICALRASTRRTSDSGCIGWPSPMSNDTTGGKVPPGHKNRSNITKLKQAPSVVGWPSPTAMSFNESHRPGNNRSMNKTLDLIGWNTPRATDGSNGGPNQSGGALPADAAMSGWVSHSSRDWKDSPGMATATEDRTRLDQLPRQVHGLISESSNALTASRGVLDAAFSRWLMGFPPSWDQSSPGWKDWELMQNLLDEIASAGCVATATR